MISAITLTLIALATFVSSPLAHAESMPDIVAGQNITKSSSTENIAALQGFLSELGYLQVPTGVSFGYYGPLTANAVAEYQANRNIAPSAGSSYGPQTKLAMYTDFEQRGWLSLLGWQD